MASPDKSHQFGIHRWGTRVCVSSPAVSVSLCCSDGCVCFTGLIMSLSVSAFLPCTSPSISSSYISLSISETGPDLWLPPLYLCRSIHRPDWQVITSQVTAAYSKSWEVIKVFFFFFLHRLFQDPLKFSELGSPCEAVPGSDSAALLALSLCAWCCQCRSLPHPPEPSLILWLKGRRGGKGLVFPVLTTVITAGQASNCSDSSACEVM